MRQMIIVSIMMLLLTASVFATTPAAKLYAIGQEIQLESDERIAGLILPDSPLYGMETAFDNWMTNFESNLTKKAERRIKIANERLSEMKVMIKKNKMDKAEKAMINQNKELEELDKIEVPEKDKLTIQEKLQRHIDNLNRVKAQVPEQAQKGLTNALENAQKSLEKKQINETKTINKGGIKK